MQGAQRQSTQLTHPSLHNRANAPQPPRPASTPARRTPAGTTPTARGRRKSPLKKILVVCTVLLVAGLATIVVLQQLKIKNELGDAAEARAIQDQVSKVMIVPQEDAVISKIEDAGPIKSQPFFADVENGDQVLVFPVAAKIVIYRPSTSQIVNAGPIIDDMTQADDELGDMGEVPPAE